jgi:putative hydroxymethylpyrimidine transport system ATP-binding protein
MLTFDHVTFTYDKDPEPVIRDLSFMIKEGEFVSLIGTSGCGKSTIFRLVNQLLSPSSGRILVDGNDIRGQKNYCGYMPQHDLLFPWRDVIGNVKLPLEIRGGFSKLQMDQMAREALKTVGLSGWEKKSPKELSGGMRQRAAFARTTLTGCDLMLLDEPFSALDYLTRLSMREWLLDQWEKERKTILFITHDVEEAVFLSNRILIVEDRPITHLRSVDVPVGYPRTRASMHTPEVAELKDQLIDLLRQRQEIERAESEHFANRSDSSGFREEGER